MVDVARMPKGQMRFYNLSCLRANSTIVADAIRAELDVKQHKRVVMIPNPLPFAKPPEIDFKAKKPILLYAGRIHPEKGLELLIEGFRTLGTDWKLQIVGPADIKAGGGGLDYLDSLKKLAGDCQVEFTGPVYDMDRLNRYYAEATVFVYPSVAEKGETFGLAPLEAMAWGCVPIVSDLTCFRDFIHHEGNGLIFDHRKADSAALLGRSIERLQNDKSLTLKLGQNALGVQSTHSIPFIASQFLTSFGKMLEENKMNTL